MKFQQPKNDPINSSEEDRLKIKNEIISTWLGRRDSNRVCINMTNVQQSSVSEPTTRLVFLQVRLNEVVVR